MDNSYNPEKLAEAIKAFGEERLEELREEFPRGRLAEYMKSRFEFVISDLEIDGCVLVIDSCFTFDTSESGNITYLEPPRPLRKEGHTKEEMGEAWSIGWYSQLRLQSEGSFETFEDWHFDKFPTATAPTEEMTEEPWRKAQEAVNDRSTKEMEVTYKLVMVSLC